MSINILKIFGGLAIAKLLFDQATTQVMDRITYEVLPVKPGDFTTKMNFQTGQFSGILKIRIAIQNNLPINLTAQSLRLRVSQQGSSVASIDTNNAISLPANQATVLAVNMEIKGSEFISRILEIVRGGDALAPFDIAGLLTFSNGDAIPISRKLEFFSVT